MLINPLSSGAGGADPSLLGVITGLNLTSGLKGVYDLGDIRSYDDVDTQTLSDSNGADDFHFGATSGSEGSDPAYNGVAGDLSSAEYASVDGGDYFKAKSQPTWIENYHSSY